MTNIFKTLTVAAVAAGAMAVAPVVASATTITPGNDSSTAYVLGTTSSTNFYFWQGGQFDTGNSGTYDFTFTANTALSGVGGGIFSPNSPIPTGYVAWYAYSATATDHKGTLLTELTLGATNTYVTTNFAANDLKVFEIHWNALPSTEVIQATVSTVPVPATGFLLLGGIGAFGALRRRKKKATA